VKRGRTSSKKIFPLINMFRLTSRLGVPFKPLEELILGLSVLALLFCSNVLQNQQSNQHLQQRTMIYSALVVLTLGIHLVIEGKRWQLYPLYMCLLLLSLIPFFISTPYSSTSTTTDNTNINMTTKSTTTILLHWAIGMFLLSLLLNILVPLLSFPSTTGSFSVGSKDIHWKLHGHQHSHYAKIFYPISLSPDNSSSSWNGFRRNVLFGNHARQSLRYFVDSMGNGMERKFLSAMTGHLVSTETNSWHNTPLIDVKEIFKLPVIIFSPGLYGTPEIYR
jgi:hypothetical protein